MLNVKNTAYHAKLTAILKDASASPLADGFHKRGWRVESMGGVMLADDRKMRLVGLERQIHSFLFSFPFPVKGIRPPRHQEIHTLTLIERSSSFT